MNLTIVIACIIAIMGCLVFALNYKGNNRVITEPIPYPKWFNFLKAGLLVVGVSCFIFAAVLASQPKSTSTKVCIYVKK